MNEPTVDIMLATIKAQFNLREPEAVAEGFKDKDITPVRYQYLWLNDDRDLCGCAVGEQCLHRAPEKREAYLHDPEGPRAEPLEWTNLVPGLPLNFAEGVDRGFTHGPPPFPEKMTLEYLAGVEYGVAIRDACYGAGLYVRDSAT
jgi:hypothetical protein